MSKQTKSYSNGLVIGSVILSGILFAQAPKQVIFANDNCPQDAPWVKQDGLSGTSFTFTAPSGKVISEACYKSSTLVIYLAGNNQNSMTINSTVTNDNGNIKDLSHASFKLADPSVQPSVNPSTNPSADPSLEPSSSPESTSTPAPSNNNSDNNSSNSTSSDNSGSNNSGSSESGQVLGAYAPTGVAEDVIMNALGSLGGLMTVAGSVLYGKKKRS